MCGQAMYVCYFERGHISHGPQSRDIDNTIHHASRLSSMNLVTTQIGCMAPREVEHASL